MFNVFLCVPIRFHCIRLLKLYACKGFRKRSYEPGSPCSVFSCVIKVYFSILLNKINDDDDDYDDIYNGRPIESRMWSIERRHFQ